jgi:hypothetical protein
METAARWKPWKNELHVFPPFPSRLENSAKNNCAEFSTVPTAPTAISPLREEKKTAPGGVRIDRIDQIRMDKKESGA